MARCDDRYADFDAARFAAELVLHQSRVVQVASSKAQVHGEPGPNHTCKYGRGQHDRSPVTTFPVCPYIESDQNRQAKPEQ